MAYSRVADKPLHFEKFTTLDLGLSGAIAREAQAGSGAVAGSKGKLSIARRIAVVVVLAAVAWAPFVVLYEVLS